METDPFPVRVCNIAKRYYQLPWPRNRLRVMEEAGVFDPQNALNFDAIREVISKNTGLIEVWLCWSEDKRYSGACLGRKSEDMVSACARFIVDELGTFVEIRRKRTAK